MKITRKHRSIVIVVFIVTLLISAMITFFAYQHDYLAERNRAGLNAQIYAERIKADFQKGIDITDSLERIVMDNNGKVNDFDAAAADMMHDYIQSIQIAPDGVVTQIYPFAGNEAGMINLFDDPVRGKVVQYSVDHNTVTMQGPFDLKQGGQGIAVRNPVFLKDQNGKKQFWGFTIVIIRVPEIYNDSLKALSKFGYKYCLDATILPLDEKPNRIAANIGEKETLTNPEKESFEIGGCTWTISVLPKIATGSYRYIMVLFGCGVAVVLLTVLTYLLLRTIEQKNELDNMAMTDELTGLLSRRGFMTKLDELLKKNQTKLMTSVFIDLDEFKSINDVHGHIIGDLALKDLADELTLAFGEVGIVGRTGGDEFSVLLVGKTSAESRELIEAVVNKRHVFAIGDGEYSYTISAGFACYPTQASDRMNLMILADEALYAAKMDGKNNCKQYEPAMANIKRTQLGFSIKTFSAGLPGAVLVYKADKDEQILYANEEMFEMTGCKDFNDFLEYTGSKFRGFILPEDRERVNQQIWEQVDSQSATTDPNAKIGDVVDYKIVTKQGQIKDVIDVGRMVHDDNYGDVFFVFIREK